VIWGITTKGTKGAQRCEGSEFSWFFALIRAEAVPPKPKILKASSKSRAAGKLREAANPLLVTKF